MKLRVGRAWPPQLGRMHESSVYLFWVRSSPTQCVVLKSTEFFLSIATAQSWYDIILHWIP